MSRCFVFLAFLLCVSFARGEAPELPEPPADFQWQWCEDIRAAFLRPKDWHFKEEVKGDTRGYFITQEKIEDGKQFTTGLTVNVIPGIRKKTGGKASEFVAGFAAEGTKDKDSVLLKPPPRTGGRLSTHIFRVKKQATIVHNLVLADDQADKVYLIIFESPEKEWDTAWKKGEPMLQKLYFEFPK